MTLPQAIATVVGCAMLGTIVGAGVGYMLGVCAPDFFVALFPRLQQDASVTQVGIGLGTVNGGLIGVGVGVLIMATLTWQQSRVKQTQDHH